MKHVGFLPTRSEMSVGKHGVDATRPDPYYQIYDPGLEKLPLPPTHGYIKSTWSAIRKQVLLFDNDPKPPKDFPYEYLSWAREQLFDMLYVAGVRSTVLDADEVEYNRSAASGWGFQQTYGNKGEFLQYHSEMIAEFWLKAHLENYVPLWKVSGKEEYAKLSKILNVDQRCFEIPNILYLSYAMRINQKFNKDVIRCYRRLWIKIGISYQRGGFDTFIKSLGASFAQAIYYMGDCSKYDKCVREVLRTVCRDLRIRLGPGTEDYRIRSNYVYDHKTQSYLITPWGQILLVLMGMKSGDETTSVDNSLMHTLIQLMFARSIFYYASWKAVEADCQFYCYADDHIAATNVLTHTGRLFSDFARRNEFYRRCGFILKESDDKVSSNVCDMTFLGAQVHIVKGTYVPKYNAGRIVSSVIRYNYRSTEPIIVYGKIVSLLVLSTYTEAFSFVTDYLRWLVHYFDDRIDGWYRIKQVKLYVDAELSSVGSLPLIPSWNWCHKFWTGEETSCLSQPLYIGS